MQKPDGWPVIPIETEPWDQDSETSQAKDEQCERESLTCKADLSHQFNWLSTQPGTLASAAFRLLASLAPA